MMNGSLSVCTSPEIMSLTGTEAQIHVSTFASPFSRYLCWLIVIRQTRLNKQRPATISSLLNSLTILNSFSPVTATSVAAGGNYVCVCVCVCAWDIGIQLVFCICPSVWCLCARETVTLDLGVCVWGVYCCCWLSKEHRTHYNHRVLPHCCAIMLILYLVISMCFIYFAWEVWGK